MLRAVWPHAIDQPTPLYGPELPRGQDDDFRKAQGLLRSEHVLSSSPESRKFRLATQDSELREVGKQKKEYRLNRDSPERTIATHRTVFNAEAFSLPRYPQN